MSKKKRYAPRFPRYAGGIRLQQTRGASIREWWAKRWLESLASKDLAGRFSRARAYAMSGQVVSLDVNGETVVADVVGLRPEPYHVRVRFRTPTSDVRERIVTRLKSEPMHISRILAGELPGEVEQYFRDEGLDLFPGGKIAEGEYDMRTSCTCPDYANPCKHSLAALIILGEEIARRPEALLELRGITMEELCRED